MLESTLHEDWDEIGTKLGRKWPKGAICCLKVPFIRSLSGVNGLMAQAMAAKSKSREPDMPEFLSSP